MKKAKVINRCIDSLYVRVMRTLLPSEWFLSEFDVWRSYIDHYEPGDEPLFVELHGVGTFRVMPWSRAPYSVVLDNPEFGHIRVWNPHKWNGQAASQTGQLFIDFRSVFLQRGGLDAVEDAVAALEKVFYADVVPESVIDGRYEQWERVARIDLAVDVSEPVTLDYSELSQYVCRSRVVDAWLDSEDVQAWADKELADVGGSQSAIGRGVTRMLNKLKNKLTGALQKQDEGAVSRVVAAGRELQTVYFGRFGSQLYARRYDKLASLAKQHKTYMLDIWAANGWGGDTEVIRTEFSLSGDFLRGFRVADLDIEDFRDLSFLGTAIPHIWQYLTHDWLRRVDVASASRVERAAVHEVWQVIQGAWQSEAVVSRNYTRRRPELIEALMAQVRGCMVSIIGARFAATDELTRIFSGVDYHSIAADVTAEIAALLSEPESEFDMLERLRLWGCDEYSDTAMTALMRAERMALGGGS